LRAEVRVGGKFEGAIRVGVVGDPPAEVSLRPSTAADEPFLRYVYASTRAKELEPVPWTDEQRRAFCDSQFDLQDTYYRSEFPSATFDAVVQNGRPAGRLLVAFGTTACEVLDIGLAPEACGRGLGTLLLQWLQTRAADAGVPVVLMVEPGNPARRLYDRLGFRLRADGTLHQQMAWQADAVGPEAWERFYALTLADADLRARLTPADDDRSLATMVVSLGLSLGLAFSVDHVLETLRARRRAWIERGIA
jgi:ribosomal protein S18 acetylase RimI-like enzyme